MKSKFYWVLLGCFAIAFVMVCISLLDIEETYIPEANLHPKTTSNGNLPIMPQQGSKSLNKTTKATNLRSQSPLSDGAFKAVAKEIGLSIDKVIDQTISECKILSDYPNLGAISINSLSPEISKSIKEQIEALNSFDLSRQQKDYLKFLTQRIDDYSTPSVIQVMLDSDNFAEVSRTRIFSKDVEFEITNSGYCQFSVADSSKYETTSSVFTASLEKFYWNYLPANIKKTMEDAKASAQQIPLE